MNDENPTLEVVSGDSLERIERAQVDIQIATAKKYPRSMALVKKAMLELATLDRETAETCFYAIRRKDKNEPGGYKIIKGPSVRLAEIAANSFGNIRAGYRIIGNDNKMITAQGACHDLEKNVHMSAEVQRRITTKDGHVFSADMQIVTGNAAGSIALRNAIFRTIPMALIKPVYDAARKAAVGDEKTMTERRARTFEKYKEIGVSKERVLNAMGKKGEEEIGLNELELLFGMFTAIKDGDATADELFPTGTDRPQFKDEERKAGADELLGKKAEEKKEEAKTETKTEKPPGPPQTGTTPAQPPAQTEQQAAQTQPKKDRGAGATRHKRAADSLLALCKDNDVEESDLVAAMKETKIVTVASAEKFSDCTAEELEKALQNFNQVIVPKAKEIAFSK